MKGHQTYVPGIGLVTYVPGEGHGRLLVLDESYSPVPVLARENPQPTPDASGKTDWISTGALAVFGLLIACLAVDVVTLWLMAWWLNR